MYVDIDDEPDPYDSIPFADRDAAPCPSCDEMAQGVIVNEPGDFYSPPFHDIVCEHCGESVEDDYS